MSEVSPSLLTYLRTPDDSEARDALAAVVADIDLGDARKAARDDAADPEAAAVVFAKLIADDESTDALVDAAKLAAQKAPRDVAGNAVAILAGEVIWRKGGQPKLAEPYFRRVRRSEPAARSVLDFYRELFGGPDDGSQLMQVLVQARRSVKDDPELRFQIAEEMASLAEEGLKSPERAIEVWRSVVREDGHDARVSAHLETLYRKAEKWTALVELLKDRVDRIEATDENKAQRIEKLLEIGELYRDTLKLDGMALTTLQRVLDIDPRHDASLQALADTYAKSKRWNDLLAVYTRLEQAASEEGDEERRITMLRKIASIWLSELGNPQRGLEPLTKVLELVPKDHEAREMLANIHEQRRDWRALVALRREQIGDLEGEDARMRRVELARLCEEKLGDRSEAIAVWCSVVENHGETDEALQALTRLYEREGRWEESVDVVRRRAERIEDVAEAVELWQHLGQVYADRLHDSAGAIDAWRHVAELAPTNERALRTLREAYVEAGQWDELTELFVTRGRAAKVVDVLTNSADREQDVETRVSLYRRVAALCRKELADPERAVKALERILAIQPENLDVARELLPIYEEAGNWSRLLATNEVLLAAARDDTERLSIIAEQVRVSGEKLGSPAQALHWAARSYALSPGSVESRASFEGAAERADGWDELTRSFEARIVDEGSENEEKLLLLSRLAEVARDRLFKPDDAQRYYRRIIEIDSGNKEALDSLEGIYSSTRRWDDLAAVYRHRLNATEDQDARLTTLRSLAGLQETQLRDLEGATATYEAILEINAEDSAGLVALTKLYRSRGDWPKLAGVLLQRLDLGLEGRERVESLFELSKLYSARLHDFDRAIEGFLEVLELDSNHSDSVEQLEQLRQAEPATELPIAKGLLPYYRAHKLSSKEAEAMEVLLEGEEDESQKLDRRRELAAIYEKMPERREDALRSYLALFDVDPAEWELRKQTQRIARELGEVERVAQAYQRALAVLSQKATEAENEGRTLERASATLRRELLFEMGGMLRDDMGDTGSAELAYAQILEHDETHQGAYEALQLLLVSRQADRELLELYRRRVDVVYNQKEQRELLGRIIEIARSKLEDRETAVRTAEELLDLVPDDLPTIQLLGRMYFESRERRDREALEELLGRWAELVDDQAMRHKLTSRRAEIRTQDLGDAFGAVDLLGQVLGENPDDPDAKNLLEQLLDITEVQSQVSDLLQPIYERHQDQAGRIRILSVRRAQAEAQGSTDRATSHLLEIAKIEECQLNNPARAFEVLREAFLLDPRRLDVRDELARLGDQLHCDEELVETWELALKSERASDPQLRIDLVRRRAEILDDRLFDPARARIAYQELLDLDPPDFELAHRAVAALCRLHLEAGDFVALVDAKRVLLRFTDEHAEQVSLRLEVAQVQLQALRDRVGAALTWSEVVDREPDNATALDALEGLFSEEDEWERLGEVLQHRIAVTSDARLQAAWWRRIGDLQRQELKDPHKALDAYASVLELRVGREETLYAQHALVEINGELERWPDVEEGLRRLVQLADDDQTRAQLLVEGAEVMGTHLGRGHDALDALKRVLDLNSADMRARALVGSYLERDDYRDQATRILTPIFESEQNWASLAELQELQARKQPSGRKRLQALLAVAKTQEERLEDDDRAFRVLCEALVEAGDQPELAEILERVERLGELPERAEALVDGYQRTVDHILDAELQQRVYRSLGAAALSRLGQLDVARKAFERVHEMAPGDDQSVVALEQIYLRQEDFDALAELLLRSAERASAGEHRDRLLVKAAEIRRTKLDDPEGAIGLYQRISEEAMARDEVVAVLEPLYEQTGCFRELATHLSAKLPRLKGDDLVDTHLWIGRLCGEQLEDPEEGMRHLATAVRLDPVRAVDAPQLDRYLEDPSMRSRAAELLEPVFAGVGDWRRLVQIQEVRLAEGPDPETRVKLLLRIAQLQEDQLEDLPGAFEGYGHVFNESPTNRHVRDQMQRLAAVLDLNERYAEILTAYVNGDAESDDSDATLEVVRAVGDLWAMTLRQPGRAVPFYRRLVNAQPEDTRAFAALESALTQANMWKELCEAYWRDADASLQESRQVDMYMRLANVARDSLGEPSEAARAYQRILEIDPDNQGARGQLEQVFAASEQWRELLDLYRDRLTRTNEPGPRMLVFSEMVEILDARLDDPEGAMDVLEQMLTEDPRSPEGVMALEQLAEKRAGTRARAYAILEPLYIEVGSVVRQIGVIEWKLSVEDDPATRHELYLELASKHDTLSDGAVQAFRALARGLGEPGPADALERLDDEVSTLARVHNTPGALADAMVAAVASEALADDVDRRLVLSRRAASLHLDAGDPEATVQVLGTALGLRAEDPEALEIMDRALVALGHHDELRRVIALRAELEVEDDKRVELYRRLARMYDEVLAQPQEAAGAWRKLLEVNPEDGEALERLSKSYEQSGSTAELVEVLQRRIDASSDGEERRGLRMRLASLYREASKDRPAEIDVLRELLTEAPSDDEALSALGRALVADERFIEAADVLQDRARIVEGEERRAALLLEAARLYRGPLEDGVGALERYEQVLAIAPSQDGAIADLVELVEDSSLSAQVAELLKAPLLEQGRHVELVKVLSARSRLSDDPAEVASSLQELAGLQYERLGDPKGALETTMMLAARAPVEETKAALQAARRLAAELGELEAHVASLDEAAAASEDPTRRANFLMAAADTLASVDGDNEGAADRLAPLLDTGEADLQVCLRLRQYAAAIGRDKLEERALSRASELVEPDSENPTQMELWVSLGTVRGKIGDLEGASEVFRDALEAEPGHGPALGGMENILQSAGADVPDTAIEVLEEAYENAGNPDGLAYLMRIRLDRADKADRAEVLRSLGQLVERGSGSALDALEIWGALLAIDAESSLGLKKMRAAAGNTELVNRAAELSALAVVQARDEDRLASSLTLLTGQMLLSCEADPLMIMDLLSPELEDSETAELLDVAVETARRTGDPQDLHGLLRRAARSASDPQASAASWREAASVAETELKDNALAIEDLRELIDSDERDTAGWDKLGALLALGEQYEPLAELFERRIDVTSEADAQRELRYRLANLLVERLDRSEDAVNIYNDMIMAAPDDLVAVGELELVLRKLEKWEEVRELVEGKLEHTQGEARAELFAELAKVCEERLKDRNEAIGIWQRALADSSGAAMPEAELSRLYELEERWRDLAELARQQMDRSRDAGDNETFRERASDLAGLLAQRLDAQGEAEEILQGLLEVDPTYVPALVSLASVYEARGNEHDAKETLKRAAALGPTGPAGARLHLKLAELSEDADAKRAALSKALECEPGNGKATRELLELARGENSWEDVVRLLEMSVVGVSDKGERRKAQLERVDVMYERLGDVDGGLRVLHSVYEEVKDDEEVNRRIADGLYRLESWEQAGGMYSWLVEVQEGKRSKELASYLTRLANIEANTGQLDQASVHLKEAYRMDTTNAETLVSLGLMYQAQEEWSEALKIYRAMLLQNADRSGQIRRGDIYLSLAKIHVALEESPKALAMLRRGVEEDSDHPELGQMLTELS